MSTFFIFQTMFAGITPSIFVGSMIGRVKMSFLLLFTVCFNIIIYAPIAYWMWNRSGWLFKMDTIDFAGENVIHIPAEFTGLAFAIFTGYGEKRSYKQNSASISLTLIGTGILWFGWFGFNGGSGLSSGALASLAVTNTHLAACAGGLAWSGLHYLITGHPSILGWCCSAICGLVAITPAAGSVCGHR
jgi:Amt family ammonium transporter